MKSIHGNAIPYHAMFDAAFRADPFPFYDYLRREAPVVWDDVLQAWVVARAVDVEAILHNPQVFSSNRLALGRQRFADPSLVPLFDVVERLMLQMDAPNHDRLRKLTAQAFKRKAIEGYAPLVEQLTRDLLAPHANVGQMDFVDGFAVPLPVLVISAILGIPPQDRDQIKRWCDDFSIVALNFYAKITDEQLRAGQIAVADFREYLRALAADLRGRGGTDLLSTLIEAEREGERLSFDELLANAILLLNAGNETTSILLINAMYIMCTKPDVTAALRADRALIPQMIEETLRYMPPVHFIGRLVTREASLGGEVLRKGDLLMIFLGSAGRDADRYDDPDAFRLDQKKKAHVSFGTGPHVCLGLQLARLEARVAINAMLDTFSSFELASTDLKFGPNLNLRCFAHLPLVTKAA
ncbi:cytochrome P450 [Sedimentitalea todarodis]|uniref:Cytochrome P450 n=1 Tax=Sedimentitalea todarodis TaxID=1631240 RepID=A0ABU3VIM9_9RHOB|nr:cytochrome P450 [Sedimentitalea todarodis]MDU9005549.1 cytochrome P450 [Sedimentitalea todarodis]